MQERGVHDQPPGLRSEYRRLPVQREVLHQDEVVAYGSYGSYPSSSVQRQPNAAGYSSYPAPPVVYAASAVQPKAPESIRSQGSIPVSSHYLFAGPTEIYP